ncbi:hypothetical protein [Tissierella creatinophila]|uniref:Uncharacterized protein n=1 Tax=Tissierella creatinophila DSM 6911 TaxID=1123403 RepID=A0A1U7M4S4_TISCR|nr:hypothetical protein [Tissierella creatinophila]OLS02286.1 hypothetical protein TICRE_16720 [Tissierella creatinophila DSM 6911]
MSKGLEYTRKFIIFKKEYGNMTALKPKGHGKLELKGNHLNFSVNIQGAEGGNFYSIELIKGREAKSIGKIYTKDDKSGKAELDINYKELERIGFSLEKIDGIILRRENGVLLGESLNENSNILKRYIEEVETKEIQYEDNIVDKESKPDENTQVQEEIELKEEFISEETQIQQETQIQEEIEPDPILLEEQFESKEDFQGEETTIDLEKDLEEELPIIEQIPIEYIEEIEVTSEEMEQIIPKANTLESAIEVELEQTSNVIVPEDMFCEQKYEQIMEEIFNIPELGYENNIILDESKEVLNNKKTRQSNSITDYVLDILNFFPYSEPFTMNLEGYNWWQIGAEGPETDKSFLPYFSYVVGGNNKSYRFEDEVNPKELLGKYGHYIFGLYNEDDKVKFYIYGIPGKFSLEEHPKLGKTGFNTWFEGREVPGYWLLYIEPETGRILYPINPMIPKS